MLDPLALFGAAGRLALDVGVTLAVGSGAFREAVLPEARRADAAPTSTAVGLGGARALPLAAGAAALVVAPAFVGHAAGAERLRTLSISADVAHVLGPPLGSVRSPSSRSRPARSSPRRRRRPPSPRCSARYWSASAVWRARGSEWASGEAVVPAHFTTTYGRLLFAQLALVAIVAALGGYNWRRSSPAVADPRAGADADPALRRSMRHGRAVAFSVPAVTAVLVATSSAGTE